MINPIKIKIKGYPKDKDSFYNENDLMQTIKIVIIQIMDMKMK